MFIATKNIINRVKGMLKMKKVKILTITLAIILVTAISFGGIYIQTQNRMENKIKN